MTVTPTTGRAMTYEDRKISTTVGANVRAEMARLGRTQAEVAELMGFDQSGLSRRLTGETPFRITELVVLARAFGIPVSRFLEALN